MGTVKENINKPEYKLLSGLVLGTEKELENWEKKELKNLKASVGRFVTRAALIRYENELTELVKQIKEGHAFYESDIAGLKKACDWTTFPNQHKPYRDMIYALERQQAKVVAEQKILEFKKAEAERAARATPTRTSSEPAPKKSSAFKNFLAWAGITAGLWGVFQWGKNSQRNSAPQEGDKAPQTMTQGVTQNGNTWSQDATSALKDRLQQARLLRLIKEEELKTEKAELGKYDAQLKVRRNSAYTGKYVKQQGQEATQGDAYTGWYVQEKGQQVIRGQAGTAQRVSEADRQIRRNTYHY